MGKDRRCSHRHSHRIDDRGLIGPSDAAAESVDAGPLLCPPLTFDDLFPPEVTSTTTTHHNNPGGARTEDPRGLPAVPLRDGLAACQQGPVHFEVRRTARGCHESHKGVDVAAPKLTPVLSVADGRVGQIRHEIGTEDCCRLVVEHDDGSERWYLHLNNDSSENRQRNRGILQACHHPLDPDHVLTRSEAVDRIAWWVLGIEPDPCPPPDQPVR